MVHRSSELGGNACLFRDADAIAARECLPADGPPRRARPSILRQYLGRRFDASTERLEPHAGLVQAALRLPESVDTKFDLLNQVMHSLHRQGRQALLFTHSRPTSLPGGRLEQDFRIASCTVG